MRSSRRSNVAYAARFLKRLRDETESWSRATAHYHSRDPDRGEAYRDKVFRLWDELLLRPKIETALDPPRGRRPWRPARRSATPEPLERARLIVPGRTGAGRQGARDAVPILRGN